MDTIVETQNFASLRLFTRPPLSLQYLNKKLVKKKNKIIFNKIVCFYK